MDLLEIVTLFSSFAGSGNLQSWLADATNLDILYVMDLGFPTAPDDQSICVALSSWYRTGRNQLKEISFQCAILESLTTTTTDDDWQLTREVVRQTRFSVPDN